MSIKESSRLCIPVHKIPYSLDQLGISFLSSTSTTMTELRIIVKTYTLLSFPGGVNFLRRPVSSPRQQRNWGSVFYNQLYRPELLLTYKLGDNCPPSCNACPLQINHFLVFPSPGRWSLFLIDVSIHGWRFF